MTSRISRNGCGWIWSTLINGRYGWTSKFCGAPSGSCSWARERDKRIYNDGQEETRSGKSQPTSVVTGGAGFLGSHLVDYLLERGHKVMAIDNLVTGSVDNIAHLAGNGISSSSSRT